MAVVYLTSLLPMCSEVVLPSYERALKRVQHLADALDPAKVQAGLEARIAAMEDKLNKLAEPLEALLREARVGVVKKKRLKQKKSTA